MGLSNSMSINILILSFYFEPDLSAGSFRSTALVKALGRKLTEEDRIEVLTTRPNRYHSYQVEAPRCQEEGNIVIERIPLPSHHSGMIDQSRSFATFARQVWTRTRGRRYDLVVATSSRLMTAVLGGMVAHRVKAPLYLDIRDIFTDTMANLFAGKPHRAVLPALRFMERWTLNQADGVNLVSPGFLEHFRALRDNLDYRVFTNGIDEEFVDADFCPTATGDTSRRVILYAGNIGEGQGLDRIVPEAAERLGPAYEIWIVGDGGMRKALEVGVRDWGVTNVKLLDPVSRRELMTLYARADYLLLHLNDHDAFRKVLPSKIFEYGATGKPILAGVAGCSRQFIEENLDNAAVFDPCDVAGLVEALGTLSPTLRARKGFIQAFRRGKIIDRLADDILTMAVRRGQDRKVVSSWG